MENPNVSKPAKVLLVDDESMGRQVVRMLLERVGFEVIEAVNGAEAVDMVGNEDFDLVLMDIQMPIMDGVAATQAIRRLDKATVGSLPILAMTADGFYEQKRQYKTAGMNAIIEKPVEMEKLYAQIRRFLPWSIEQKEVISTDIPAPVSADLEAALPGVDVKAGLHRMLDNRQAYLVLLRKFVANYCSTAQLLQAELEAGKHQDAIRRVHTIKGVAGGLGATALQQAAAQLELQLSGMEAPTAMNEMLLELRHLLDAIENMPPEVNGADDGADNGADKPSGSARQLAEQLGALIEPLHNLQVSVIHEHMTTIQQTLWAEEYHSDLHQLQLLTDAYQYSRATELLHSLLSRIAK